MADGLAVLAARAAGLRAARACKAASVAAAPVDFLGVPLPQPGPFRPVYGRPGPRPAGLSRAGIRLPALSSLRLERADPGGLPRPPLRPPPFELPPSFLSRPDAAGAAPEVWRGHEALRRTFNALTRRAVAEAGARLDALQRYHRGLFERLSGVPVEPPSQPLLSRPGRPLRGV